MKKEKLLLTSSGITTNWIQKALVDLLGKPIDEACALFVPTAIYPYPQAIQNAWQLIKMPGELGWKAFGVLELTALPSLPIEVWLPQVEKADAIIIGGGNKFYLSYWMGKSGLFGLLPELIRQGTVYVGISAGSMMLTPSLNFNQEQFKRTGVYYDDEFDEEMSSSAGSAKTLGLVHFGIRPHLDADYFPQATLENVEKWAARVDYPLYALDDQSAVKVADGKVEVVSSGTWKLL
ncbi:MAG: Type 1 glutamine amidotransferase-like domain-containing protein [Candidatus Promineifilaceae bacterium]